MKFKHLEKAHVAASATSRVEFPEIEPLVRVETDADGAQREVVVTPWLEVRPGGETNKAFMNASLKKVNAQRLLKNRMSVEDNVRDRAEALPLYAEHVLTGAGGGWVDAETNLEASMPLSPEQRLMLLKSLPPDLFDRVRIHANDLGNFRG